MVDRSADATIKGYLYQFDKYILAIIGATGSQTVVVEGIEDVDIMSGAGCEAIQCKYLPSKKYSLASIRDAILPMLGDTVQRRRKGHAAIQYRLYAHFSWSSPKTIDLTLADLKQCLLTKKQDGALVNHQTELKATDADLTAFLCNFQIEIAEEYDAHRRKVLDLIKTVYACSADEETDLYYNNALSTVSLIAAESDVKKRSMTKQQFLARTRTKQALYSVWRLQELGRQQYCQKLHRQHFVPPRLNVPAYARFFIIECDGLEKVSDAKGVLLKIRQNWSSHHRRRKDNAERYAPYIVLPGLKPEQLVDLKTELFNEDIKFTDGCAFDGASFSTDELNKPQTRENELSMRFVSQVGLLPNVFASLKKSTKEVYQFYRTKPFTISGDIKNVQMRVEDISYVADIV